MTENTPKLTSTSHYPNKTEMHTMKLPLHDKERINLRHYYRRHHAADAKHLRSSLAHRKVEMSADSSLSQTKPIKNSSNYVTKPAITQIKKRKRRHIPVNLTATWAGGSETA